MPGSTEASRAGSEVGLGGPRQRLVLAHLLIRANQTVPVDRLIAGVWLDGPPPAARRNLQGYVSQLRKALGAEVIAGRGQGYQLRVEPDQVDRMRFEALAERGARCARRVRRRLPRRRATRSTCGAPAVCRPAG